MLKSIKSMIEDSIAAKEKVLKGCLPDIERGARLISSCIAQGNKLMLCGNGGSAADCQHVAGELVGRFKKERKGMACIALTTDTSVLTAWANDYDYESVFSRQVEALGRKGDVLIGISTSGNSANVIKAFDEAKKIGIKTIGLTGKDGGKMKGMVDIDLIVPCSDTPRIQECHIMILHIICELVENGVLAE